MTHPALDARIARARRRLLAAGLSHPAAHALAHRVLETLLREDPLALRAAARRAA